MKQIGICILLFCSYIANAQELYVYTEPASNMPARSISTRLTAMYMPAQKPYNRFIQRYTPEIMFGINKNWMVHVATTFADMQTNKFRWESVYLYGKYRFFSVDDLHSHFRMAVFGEASYNRSPFHHYEINLQGDNTGAQLGLIATQLKGKLAVSGTVSHVQVFDKDRNDKTRIYLPPRFYQVMNYSLSAGYLLLPREYTDYRQTNVNLYAELLAQQALERKAYYVDLAPAVQFIFNSNAKLNIGYRFQLDGDMQRGGEYSWLVSFERTFLNALARKKRKDD
jgi:hypothetical protein